MCIGHHLTQFCLFRRHRRTYKIRQSSPRLKKKKGNRNDMTWPKYSQIPQGDRMQMNIFCVWNRYAANCVHLLS